jgi:hypothetical protein
LLSEVGAVSTAVATGVGAAILMTVRHGFDRCLSKCEVEAIEDVPAIEEVPMIEPLECASFLSECEAAVAETQAHLGGVVEAHAIRGVRATEVEVAHRNRNHDLESLKIFQRSTRTATRIWMVKSGCGNGNGRP